MGIPYGLICTCLGVALGGMLGRALRRWIRDELREKLPMLCGITAICSGILSVIRADQMPVVTFSVLLGGWLGVLLRLEQRVRNGFGWVLGKLSLPEDLTWSSTSPSWRCSAAAGSDCTASWWRGSAGSIPRCTPRP